MHNVVEFLGPQRLRYIEAPVNLFEKIKKFENHNENKFYLFKNKQKTPSKTWNIGVDFSNNGKYMALAERRDCKDFVSIFSCDTWSLIRVSDTLLCSYQGM